MITFFGWLKTMSARFWNPTHPFLMYPGRSRGCNATRPYLMPHIWRQMFEAEARNLVMPLEVTTWDPEGGCQAKGGLLGWGGGGRKRQHSARGCGFSYSSDLTAVLKVHCKTCRWLRREKGLVLGLSSTKKNCWSRLLMLSSGENLADVTAVVQKHHSGEVWSVDEVCPEVLKILGIIGLRQLTCILSVHLGRQK